MGTGDNKYLTHEPTYMHDLGHSHVQIQMLQGVHGVKSLYRVEKAAACTAHPSADVVTGRAAALESRLRVVNRLPPAALPPVRQALGPRLGLLAAPTEVVERLQVNTE